MTRHPGKFIAARPLPAAEAVELAPSASTPKRWSLRPLLFAAAGLAAIVAGAYYGREYWTVGRFEISTDDAYVQADNIDCRPEGFRLSRQGAGGRQRTRQGRAGCWLRSTTVTSGWRSIPPRPTSPPLKPRYRPSGATLDAQDAVIASARATLGVDQANLTFAEQENKRYSTLAASGYGTREERAGRGVEHRGHPGDHRARHSRSRHVRAARSTCSRRSLCRPRPRLGAPRRAKSRPNSISPTPLSRPRSTAWSATARCASGNMSRRERI